MQSSESLVTPINSEPKFIAKGAWGDGFDIARVSDGTGGVIVGPGIDNSNIFAQSVSATRHKYIRLVARARAVEGNRRPLAAFQVNWLTASGAFISCSRATFLVSQSIVTESEVLFRVPRGAETWIVYVAPGDRESQIQYFEMFVFPASGPIGYSQNIYSEKRRWLSRLRSATIGIDRPDGFWESVSQDRPIYFVHIPKTAGHSVYATLEANYPDAEFVRPYSGVEGNIQEILALPKQCKEVRRVIACHMPMGVHHYLGAGTYISFLRNPLDIIVSGYFFNMERLEAPNHALQASLNRSIVQFAEYYDNSLTRYLVASSFTGETYWLSGEVRPGIANVSYIGLDFFCRRHIRTLALMQWNAPLNGGRFSQANVLEKAVVECSDDNFQRDCRFVCYLNLINSRELHAYSIPGEVSAQYWRVRAMADPPSARWGVVALRFFECEKKCLPAGAFEQHAIAGQPICSSAMENCAAGNAFDGHDRPALWQIPPGAVQKCHCEEAMENLRKHFLIGLTEEFDLSHRLIGHALNWRETRSLKLNSNVTRRDRSILTERERKVLLELNRFDVLLYEFAQQLFRADLRRCFG